MNTRPVVCFAVAVALALGGISLLRAAGAPRSAAQTPQARDAGYAALLAGDDVDARERFTARLVAEPHDLSAAIGLTALLEAQGDADGAAATLARALEDDARGALAAGALARLVSLVPRLADGGIAIAPLLERIVTGEIPISDPEVRALAFFSLQDVLTRGGFFDRAIEIARARGHRIEPWTIVGPFGRFATLDLDRPFPPEDGVLDVSQASRGPSGFAPLRIDTHFPGGRLLMPGNVPAAGVAYAITDLVADERATLRVRVSAFSSYRVYLDGQRVLVRDDVLERPASGLAIRVTLEPGRHRLMIKIPGERGYPAVAAILSAEDGGAVERVRAVPVADGEPLAASHAEAWPVPLDACDPGALASDPALAMASAWWLRSRELDRESGRVLEALHEAYPDAPLFAYLLGEHVKNASTGAAASADLSRARTLFERALASDAGLARARLLTAQIDEAAGRLSEAWDLAQLVREAAPGDADAPWLQARLARKRGFALQADRLLEAARAIAPARLDLIEAHEDVLRETDAVSRLRELLREMSRRDPYDTSWAELLSSAGEVDEALLAWDRAIALRPSHLYPRIARATLLADAGRPDDALAELDRARALYPDEARIADRRAAVLALSGRREDAIEELKRTLALDPSRIDVRATLDALASQPLGGGRLANVADLVARAGDAPSGVDSALLSDVAIVHVDRLGGQTEVYQGVHAVYTLDGVEAEGELAIQPGSQVEGVRIRKRDGRMVDVTLPNRPPFSLPGLEPGDVVEYVWRRYIPPMRFAGGALDNNSIFLFQGADRDYLFSRYVVSYDEGLPLAICGNDRGLEIERTVEAGVVTQAWTAREMPRIALEPHIPDPTEVIPHVRLGMNLSWSDVGDVIRQSVRATLVPDPPLPELAQRARERASDGSVVALARAIHEIVGESIAPAGPALNPGRAASAAASSGEGNRTGIALALARMLGLEARLVFARPIEARGRQMDCPTLGEFGYVMVEIQDGDQSYFLDHNDVNHAFDTIPPRFAGSDALRVPLDPVVPVEIVDLPEREPGVLEELVADVALGSDGLVSGTLEVTLRGSIAAVLRKMLREVPDDRRPLAYQAIATSSYPGAEIIASDVVGLELEQGDVRLRVGFVNGTFGRRTATGYAAPIVTSPLGVFSEYAGLNGRRFPLLFDAQEYRRDVVRMRLPSGLGVASMPRAEEADGPFGRYRLGIRQEADTLIIEREAMLPPRRVMPEEYGEFRRFANSIDEAERQELLLRAETPSLR